MCQCQDDMEETGRIETAESITVLARGDGKFRVRIQCPHGDMWETVLLPGDPLTHSFGFVLSEIYAAA